MNESSVNKDIETKLGNLAIVTHIANERGIVIPEIIGELLDQLGLVALMHLKRNTINTNQQLDAMMSEFRGEKNGRKNQRR